MNENVVVIKRHQSSPFPELWPKATLESVCHALHRNQPLDNVPSMSYHFAMKPDLATVAAFNVIVQPNSSILWQSTTQRKSDQEAFLKWFTAHQRHLLDLSASGFTGIISGKMARIDDADYFCVYYITKGREVYIDQPNLDRLLKMNADQFDGSVITVPIDKLGLIRIDKALGDVTVKDVTEGLTGTYVGLPVVCLEPRSVIEGIESDAAPRVLSTDVHMRYSAFLYGAPVARLLRSDYAPSVGKML